MISTQTVAARPSEPICLPALAPSIPMKRAFRWIPRLAVFALVFLGMLLPRFATAIDNSASIPVLLYHSHEFPAAAPCTSANTAAVALEHDLATLHQEGFTVVPAYWIAEWARGLRDASTLPARVVGITFDDGADFDWNDWTHPTCGLIKSFRRVLQEFKAAHPELPWNSPHASSFVIASPAARATISAFNNIPINDNWWYAANQSGIIEIYNHGADHDHSALQSTVYDSSFGAYIPVNGAPAENRFYRTDTSAEAYHQVVTAAAFITGRTGAWPDLFAYPRGEGQPDKPDNFIHEWFVNNSPIHNTFAAFCLGESYVTRASPAYCLPRYSYLQSWASNPAFFRQILRESGQYSF